MVATVIALSLAPAAPLPEVTVDYDDKIAHGFAYGTLMVWFAVITVRDTWVRVALRLFALGAGLECCHALLPYRSASFADVLANTGGILLGAIVAFALTTGSSPPGRAE